MKPQAFTVLLLTGNIMLCVVYKHLALLTLSRNELSINTWVTYVESGADVLLPPL